MWSIKFIIFCSRTLAVYHWVAHARFPLWFIKFSDSPPFSEITIIKRLSLFMPTIDLNNGFLHLPLVVVGAFRMNTLKFHSDNHQRNQWYIFLYKTKQESNMPYRSPEYHSCWGFSFMHLIKFHSGVKKNCNIIVMTTTSLPKMQGEERNSSCEHLSKKKLKKPSWVTNFFCSSFWIFNLHWELITVWHLY